MMKHFTHIIFDWGDTLMTDDQSQTKAMYLWPEVHAVEGAAEVMDRLSHTFTLCVATSAAQSDPEMVRMALRRVSLDHYVSSVFTGKTIGRKKTDSEFWYHIQRTLNVTADALLVVGDSFESDVLTPSKAGFTAVWFNPYSKEVRTGEKYSTIHGLDELIQKAEQSSRGGA